MKQKTGRRTDDALWKGLLENIFDDFLRFFFPDADLIFNMKKGFTYMDKELAELFPNDESSAPKHVDKLVKVFDRSGKAKFILIHIEIQGQKDREFAWRMYTYYYRILDRYKVPVTAVAILTDSNKNFRPAAYQSNFLGTINTFKFNTYKVLDQSIPKLEGNKNPFAIAILTVLVSLKSRNLKDEQLFDLKYQLLRNLYRRDLPRDKINYLLVFLQLYVHFENKDYNLKFEKVIENLAEKTKTMGIIEFVLDRAKKEGVAEGELKGIQRGMETGIQQGKSSKEYEKNLAFTKSLLTETEFDDEKIARMVGVDIDFVRKIREEV